MPNIKEIALKVWYSRNECMPADGMNKLTEFAEALVAEIQRESEPVGYKMTLEELLRTDGRTPVLWFGQLPHGSLLFTFPPDKAQIEQRVAEACARVYLDTYDLTDIAEAIRSGAWKEFKND